MEASTHTFLFADLVGFTALAELEGDDRAVEVALGLQRRVREMLEEQLDDAGAARSSEAGGRERDDSRAGQSGEAGGRVAGTRESLPAAEQVKAIGDGLMLRCNEPQAAIMLGLRLVEDLDGERGFPPVRVGIHTGPAIASDGDWYGRTVNVAARLCSVAPGGEVMVSQSTREAAGSVPRLEWGSRELHWLRNVSEPVGTYLVRSREEPVPRLRRRKRRGLLRWSCGGGAIREATV